MPIIHARVDERLIHGQVAMVWTNTVGATRIAVVNDEVVNDEMEIAALKISKPAGVKLSILSKAKAIEKFESDFYGNERVFLICKNIADMIDLVNAGDFLKGFNIGNVSRRDGARMIKRSVYLTQSEIDALSELGNQGIKITAQMIPNESDQSIENFI